jgi:hypothetical protein
MTIRKVTDTEGTVTLPPVGLPSRKPTQSYWLREPSPILLGHRTTDALPETADVVIVGSGITGAFAAKFLKEGIPGQGEEEEDEEGRKLRKEQKVVMLEAREACSGATGRVSSCCCLLAPLVSSVRLSCGY